MHDEHTTVVVVPSDGSGTRTYVISRRRLTLLKRGVGLLAGVALLVGGWVGVRAFRVTGLERRVAELEAERAQTAELAQTLEALEARYAQLRALFGIEGEAVESEVWLPPPAGTRPGAGGTSVDDPTPTAWPLADRGFVTRTLLEGGEEGHPGLDIAVPADSYVRAAGAGIVVEAGEDLVYGRFLVVDHGDGYRSRYAHANLLFVAEGDSVGRHEVIALSGNTGRSTAPHLHFEILHDGIAVDPLTLVQPPA